MSGLTVKGLKEYESGEQVITSGGLLTLSHGLGVIPKIVELRLICKAATSGFSIGDEILITNAGSSSGAFAQSVVLSDTTIEFRYEDSGTCFTYSNHSSGAAVALTNSSWRLKIKAFA